MGGVHCFYYICLSMDKKKLRMNIKQLLAVKNYVLTQKCEYVFAKLRITQKSITIVNERVMRFYK